MTTSPKQLVALLPILFSFSLAYAQTLTGKIASTETSPSLPGITVYASRFEEKLVDALPQTRILTAVEIQKSGASNVSEVLSKVAGLPVRTNLDGSTNAVIDMRGYGDTASNNLVVLQDGVRLSETEQTVARTSMIPLEAIDHIEITPGGNSVLYGDGATGGTINIITKKDLGQLTAVSAGLGSFSRFQSDIFHSQSFGSSQLSLFGRQYASDHYRINSKGSEQSTGANWIHQIDAQTQVGARFFASRERNKLPGALPSILLKSASREPQVPGYNYDADVDSKSLTLFGVKSIGNAEFAIDLNKRVRNNSDAYRYDAYLVSSYYDPSIEEQSFGNSNSRMENQSISPRIKLNNFIMSGNSLQFGYDWQGTIKSGGGFLTFGYGYSDQLDFSMGHQKDGFYFRDVWNLSESDRLVLGYRNEAFSQSYTKKGMLSFEAKGTANAGEFEYVKKFQDYLTGYMRLSQNFRMPNADDNNNVAASPLDVQLTRDLEIGFNHRSELAATTLSYFRSRAGKEVGYDPAGCSYESEGFTNYYGCNVNYEPTRRDGVNFKQILRVSKAINLSANLQYVNAKFAKGVYAGKFIPSVSPYTGHLSVDYQMSPSQQVSLTSRFAASRHASGDYLNDQAKLAGYAVQDFSYFYRVKNWSLVASIHNIANKKYAETSFYKPETTGYLYPYNMTLYPNPGRSLSLTGRYVF
jgi:iron complex outermembrane receptor protein